MSVHHVKPRVLFVPTAHDPIVEHALYYASNNGWHVFPVPPGKKKSHKSAERSDGRRWGATIDADEIRADFKRWPDANIGIVMGEQSGVFVVETDTAEGHGEGTDGAASLKALEEVHGDLPATREAISPSGSIHRFFRHPGPGIKIKNSASEIAHGVDVRGDGGMVVGVPSIKPSKGIYKWRNTLPIADPPAWLIEMVKEKPAPRKISERALATVQPPDEYAHLDAFAASRGNGAGYIERALNDEYDSVAKAPKGTRNPQLNKSALKLGHYVGGGVLDESVLIDRLMDACAANGLIADDGDDACLATIMSGMAKGRSEPKGIPERVQPDQRDANAVSPGNALPNIQIRDGQLSALATATEEMLIAARVPIYQRGGKLVRPIIQTVDASRGRKTKVAQLHPLDGVYTRDLMGRHAVWVKWDGRTKKLLPTNAPMEVASTMLGRVGDWTFPTITGVISTPTMRPDGSLLTKQGFDDVTGLLLVEPPAMPDIPDIPTRDDALAALALLEGLLTGFPFADDISKACALSALITPVARGAFPVTPLHAARAPTAGSGKSFLFDVVAAIAIGQLMPVMSTGANMEETEKRLSAALLRGQPLLSIDNISGELGGDTLCQVIERPVVVIRILGRTEDVSIECKNSTFATGNNFVVLGDVCRRVIVVSLDPAMERPELRQFRSDPVDMVLRNRGAYIAAALTICRAYFVAGRPGAAPRLASFEGWSDTVRSALMWCGTADPVKSMEAAQAEDPERIELSNMLEGWAAAIGVGASNRSKLSRVVSKGLDMTRPSDEEPLEPTYPEFHAGLLALAERATGKRGVPPDATMLGQYLRRFKGRVVNGKRFVNLPDEKRGALWWVEEIKPPS